MTPPKGTRIGPPEAAASETIPSPTAWFSLVLVRAVWLAVNALTAGLIAVGVPRHYAALRAVCTDASNACLDNQLTPASAAALADLGLPLDAAAAYNVAIDASFALAFLAAGSVIGWWRWVDRGALLIALLLPLAGFTFSFLPDVLIASGGLLGQVARLTLSVDLEPLVLLLFLFPDGRFAPTWGRWPAAILLALILGRAVFPGSALDWLTWHLAGAVVQFGLLGSGVLAQVQRYRLLSGPRQRAQTKWVVFGVAIAAAGFVGTVALGALLAPAALRDPGTTVDMAVQLVSLAIIYGSLTLVPLSIGVAILRHRLYDIDVLINRTLVYGVLSASLAGVYLGSVVLLEQGLRALTGHSSQLAIVASTLAVAALFQPLRRRFQALIDRHFYRRKYDATRVVAAFAATMRDETDLDRLQADLLATVDEALQPAYVALWLRPVPARPAMLEEHRP
jgi:hypothetical protein